MVHVAKVMAGTAVDALLKPEIIAAAKADDAARAGGVYFCPLLAYAVPPIGTSLTA